jgi:hypothetical protein
MALISKGLSRRNPLLRIAADFIRRSDPRSRFQDVGRRPNVRPLSELPVIAAAAKPWIAYAAQSKALRGSQRASSWKWISTIVIKSMVMKNGIVPRKTSPIEPSLRTAWIT